MTAKGFDFGGKYSQDPIGSEKARGKDTSQRKHRLDGTSWTPSERYLKDKLMRQFMRTGEGDGGVSEAYRAASCWCAYCGRHFRVEGADVCFSCLNVSTGDKSA